LTKSHHSGLPVQPSRCPSSLSVCIPCRVAARDQVSTTRDGGVLYAVEVVAGAGEGCDGLFLLGELRLCHRVSGLHRSVATVQSMSQLRPRAVKYQTEFFLTLPNSVVSERFAEDSQR
jgi:hypothetical protein